MTVFASFAHMSMRQSGRLLRLFCALAVSLVATFHACDVTATRMVDAVPTLSASSDDGVSGDVVVVEKCHICAVVSLPSLLPSDGYVKTIRSIPPGSTLHMAPFNQPSIGPPPRA